MLLLMEIYESVSIIGQFSELFSLGITCMMIVVYTMKGAKKHYEMVKFNLNFHR